MQLIACEIPAKHFLVKKLRAGSNNVFAAFQILSDLRNWQLYAVENAPGTERL